MQGFILCGGQSHRMGQDKAQLNINGTSMANLIAEELTTAGLDAVFMVTKPNKTFETSFEFIFDMLDVRHPLSGLATALNHTNHEHAMIICCDLPWIRSADIQTLLMGPFPCVGSCNGERQPLCGIYPKSWKDKALFFAGSNKRVKDFARPCHSIELGTKSLKNVNYPCDLGDWNADR